jgi:hypothetical protein
MLDYLDGLCAALLARNGTEIRRLLRHPLARALPRRVREEGYSIARAGTDSLRAPIQTLHFYHQTLHLLGARTSSAKRTDKTTADATEAKATEARQIEMPLRASGS